MNVQYLLREARYYKKLGKGHFKRMLIKFILAKTLLSKLVNKTIYNKIYSSRIKKQSEKIKPKLLQIETTNFCNAKCIMCPHIYMKRKQKNMSQEEFIKICKNILPYENIELMVLSGFGEPFIDSGLIDKIKWINQNYPKMQIDLYTNASLLTTQVIEEFLKLKIHKINFSINGTEKSYQKIMKLDYGNTKKNIIYFLKKRKENKINYPLVNLSLMIIEENKNEIEKIINFWENKVDSVMAYLPSDWAGKLKISSINKNPFPKKRWPCQILWNSITVDVEGNFIMCCRDYESKIKFGNLLKENILKIKGSKKFKDLLKNQLDYKFNTPICSSCDNSFDSSLNWW